jgi:hypothetical protein
MERVMTWMLLAKFWREGLIAALILVFAGNVGCHTWRERKATKACEKQVEGVQKTLTAEIVAHGIASANYATAKRNNAELEAIIAAQNADIQLWRSDAERDHADLERRLRNALRVRPEPVVIAPGTCEERVSELRGLVEARR